LADIEMSEDRIRLLHMGVEKLLKEAWVAVEKAGVPVPLQEIAFKEAVDYLRHAAGDGDEFRASRPPKKRPSRKSSGSKSEASQTQSPPRPQQDEKTFFSELANESGVDEKLLRDVLQLKEDAVHVIPPTRRLGKSKAEQTRRVIALVAGAYTHGLATSPVDAEVVRAEAKRKRCFDPANFAATLKKLKGFSQGSDKNEIMVGSKWLDEFQEAITTATDEGGEGA
jgi:hypothetical protein